MNDEYRIDVKDFGPIAQASVGMRPLTIFIGPSNTGKSYLAILLYALHRCFGEPGMSRTFRYPLGRWSLSPSLVLGLRSTLRSDPALRASVKAWAATATDDRNNLQDLPEHITSLIRGSLENIHDFDTRCARELARCFGLDDLGDLARRRGASSASHAYVSLHFPQKINREPVAYELVLGTHGVQHKGRIPDLGPLPADDSRDRELLHRAMLDFDDDSFSLARGLAVLASHFYHSMCSPILRDVYYFPADRTGVMHSHQVVVNALIDRASAAGLSPSPDVPLLSGVVADFLRQLISISSRSSRRRQKRGRLAKSLEINVLEGAVRVEDSETGYPAFVYRPSGWSDDLPLMRASSMVSELAPVVLYLRHLVYRGNVLIVEEPEAHLHPAMQTVLARELARLVHAGVRIVMTTHSEWLLEQIGNLVRLSALKPKRREGIDGADVALRPDQVGAWLFKRKKRPVGSVVEPVVLDPDTGLYPTDYDDVSLALYNESARIFNRLQEDAGK